MLLAATLNHSYGQTLKINDLGYFEAQGVNVLVYSNLFTGGFNDEKNAGIELIHHGVRTAQGGAVRLSGTPEQWDLVPAMPARNVDPVSKTIEVGLRYDDYDFDSRVVVTARGNGVEISVYLDKPVPSALEGNAGFNLEFLPSQYWNKVYLADGRYNRFPRYVAGNSVTKPNNEKIRQFKGYVTSDDRGTGRFIDPLPLETGRTFILAPDDPERMMKITSTDADLMLLDGRVLAQNGWFVVRSLLPAGKTGKVLTWTVEPNAIKGWIREPNIGFSQVGYIPTQPKVSVIELDKKDKPLAKASVFRVYEDGSEEKVFSGKIVTWGDYFKYRYVKFDFSPVQTPGIYYIQYGRFKTNNFLIENSVYDRITEATSDVWIPIHMNHMFVNEAYRVWHGEPFREGYLQAPPNTSHFDLHWQGPATDTRYKPLELIPGLNVGGFFDAGDFDIETGSNIMVVRNFVRTWEYFKPLRDQTFVDQKQRYVDLHRPDGTPDILQFIEHGTLNLVAQAENIGHMAQALSNSVLDNYHHLGDAASITDGLPYNPDLGPYEIAADGRSSGVRDDMWAFTNRNPGLDLSAATVFAAASRALKGYNDDLAGRALQQSKRLLEEATVLIAGRPQDNRTWGGGPANLGTYLELFISTGEQEYRDKFLELLWPSLDRFISFSLLTALDALPYMDAAYREKLRPYVVKFGEYIEKLEKDNPYGVPIGLGNWAGGGEVVNFGTTVCFASKYFPDIIDADHAFKTTNWLFGCHPYHNYSFVAAVGAARPKAVFYGNNRADFSFIPGNVAPGVLFRKPDHFENYDDWPFLWGQNEGTIAGNTGYLIFGSAFRDLVKSDQVPVVETTSGAVSGTVGDGVYSFRGIPYARAERFMPPREPEPWNDVLECNDFGPVAKQIVAWIADSVMDEKKLFSVNVWTQGISDGKKRPVMLWLHGGGFHVGSSNDPMTYGKALAKKGDVVVVSLNHRLNILGFLDLSACGEKYAQSANVGMLDIVKAMEWVRKNIENFGGNPDDVTVLGESGGGGKVGTLMCMPAARGLFNKAIIQSGTLLNVMDREQSQALGMAVLKKLGLTPDDVERLDTIPYMDLVMAGNEAVSEIYGPRTPGTPTMYGFVPSADGNVLLQQPFSPGFADISKDIPLMIGTTFNELMRTYYAEKDLSMEQARERLVKEYGDRTDEYIRLFSEAYPGYTPQDLISVDNVFRPYTIRAADARARQGGAPLYVYFLAWKSPVEGASKGSFHGLDIPLAFYNVDLRPDWTGNSEEAWKLSEKMSSAWLNFAKTGDPNAPGKLPSWEPYTVENGATMYFDNECRIVHNHDRELMHLVRPVD
jgi:carboxylesterase type B